jgi:GNAT superfamily N-acetyltransferase
VADWEVRRARAADLPAVQALQEGLRREHVPLDERYRLSDDVAARFAADLRVWVRSDADRIFVADAGADGIVGIAIAHLAWPAPIYLQRLMVWVDDLYVVPAWRRRGVGQGLLDALREWGAAAGAEDLRAGVLAANELGRRFWAAAGGSDYSVTVALPLTPED